MFTTPLTYFLQPNFEYTSSQHDIANLLLSLKVISFEELVTAVNETLKEAGVKATKVGVADKAAFPTEAPLLELLHGCVKALPTAQLQSCWLPFQSLFADAPLASLPPRAVFLLFMYVPWMFRSFGTDQSVTEFCATMCGALALRTLLRIRRCLVPFKTQYNDSLKLSMLSLVGSWKQPHG
ncbi:unnamed protein product [Cylicostephanus goldi]|uniref:Uncharacterized protein n=1 Tax=Cylicostephanus goldi TaxID=71465 RepID=A0A3P7Q6M6_CYLGO|nr:unnamed protein product [Cylicostephanus goldi]